MASDTTHVTLTPMDHVPPGSYSCALNYIPLKTGVSFAEAFNVLQRGLNATFAQLPWLSGRVWLQSPETPGWRQGQLEIQYNAKDIAERVQHQLKYNELQSELSYSEVKEMAFPPDAFDDDSLISFPFMPDINSGPDVYIAQANFIPGGCLLVTSAHHSAADGGAMASITKLWADNCRAWQPGSSVQAVTPLGPENSDRTLLEKIWSKEWRGTYPVDAERLRVLGVEPPRASSGNDELFLQCRESKEGKISKSAYFYVSQANFIALQKACRDEIASQSVFPNPSGPGSEISGIDALCALMWRSLFKVRVKAAQNHGMSSGESGHEDAMVRLDLIADGRNNFPPSLPSPYLGNLSVVNQCFMPCSTLISQDVSFGTIAQTIRHHAKSINPSSLLDAYTLARDVPDLGKLVLRNSAIDGPSMVLSPLVTLASLEFGGGIFQNGGKPDAMRLLTRSMNVFTRTGFVLPKQASGGVEFVVNVFDEELELLLEDEEFGQYAMHLC